MFSLPVINLTLHLQYVPIKISVLYTVVKHPPILLGRLVLCKFYVLFHPCKFPRYEHKKGFC